MVGKKKPKKKSNRKSKKTPRKKKTKRFPYPSEEEILKSVEKVKIKRTPERRINIISLIFLLLLLLVLMYIGSSIKGQFVMSQCVDTDYGRNPFMKGTIRFVDDGNIKTLDDVCIDETHLKEFYCQNGMPTGEVIQCENGCANDMCRPSGECSDSDGGVNPDGKGLCTDSSGIYTDECYSNRELTEYYCSNNMCMSTKIVCDGVCYAGRCVPDIETGKILECEEQLGECVLPVECRNVKGSVIGECSNGYVCCQR